MTENKAIDETFEDYIRNERDKFVLSMNRWYSDNVPARVAAENIIIAYDQMRDKLEEYAQQQLAPSWADAELARQRYYDKNSKDWDKEMLERYGHELSQDADRVKEGYEQALKDVAFHDTPTQNADEQPAERAAQTDGNWKKKDFLANSYLIPEHFVAHPTSQSEVKEFNELKEAFKAGYKQRSDELKDDSWKQKLAEAFHQRSFEDFRSDEQSIALWMAENLL